MPRVPDPAAAAASIPALIGLVIRGVAVLRSTTPDIIPIAKLATRRIRDRCRSRVPRPRCSPTFVSPGSRPISICQSGTICRSSNRFAPAPPC